VAIKRLHPSVSADQRCVQMLIDEARITAQLMHANICQVIDLGVVEGDYFIAMEYVPGMELAALRRRCIEAKIDFPVDAALFIVSEVLAGLDYAHRRTGPDGKPSGLVHRDISPQNILISHEGEVKIIDFGIAKARNRLVQTTAGMIKGKYQYMSPEQALGRPLDRRTDIYSAGTVLYELLRGRTPLAGLDHSEMVRRIVEPRYEPLRRLRRDVPRALDRIIQRALERKPDRRYGSAQAFSAALADVLQTNRRYGGPELAAFVRSVCPSDASPARRPMTLETQPTADTPFWEATVTDRDEPLFHDTAPGPPPRDLTRTLAGARLDLSRRVTRRADPLPPVGLALEQVTRTALDPEPPSLPPPLASLADDVEFRSVVFGWRRLALPLVGIALLGAVLVLTNLVSSHAEERTRAPGVRPARAGPVVNPLPAAAREVPRRPRARRPASPPPEPEPRKGTLQVTSVHHGVVFIEGKEMGHAPVLTLQLPEGRHRVDVYFPDLESSTSDWVTINAARPSTLHLRP
jgi:hypothetical protein